MCPRRAPGRPGLFPTRVRGAGAEGRACSESLGRRWECVLLCVPVLTDCWRTVARRGWGRSRATSGPMAGVRSVSRYRGLAGRTSRQGPWQKVLPAGPVPDGAVPGSVARTSPGRSGAWVRACLRQAPRSWAAPDPTAPTKALLSANGRPTTATQRDTRGRLTRPSCGRHFHGQSRMCTPRCG